MKTIHRFENKLLSSDWHVLHQNIYWFVPEARSKLTGMEINEGLGKGELLTAERKTYQLILDEVKEEVEKGGVEHFIFLGDLVFGLNKRKNLAEKLETIARDIPQFQDLFDFLKAKGIRRSLLLGNHDDYKLQNAAAHRFYEGIFDDISHHHQSGKAHFTHFPIGYSIAQEATERTPEEKYFRMSKTFKRLDKELLEKIGDQDILNFHGHIHQGPFPYALPNVTYRNMAIDILVVEQEG